MKCNAMRPMHVAASALLVMMCASAGQSLAGPREQAKRIHDRLVGTPPTAATLDAMAAKVAAGDGVGAAIDAMRNPAFYNTTLKNFVTPWTNEDKNVFAELNDYTATVIGMVRDDVPFNEVLSADILYQGAPGIVTADFSLLDNAHYVELETARVDLSDPAKLVRTTQSAQAGSQVDATTAAGVMTTRAFAEAFFKDGTNRRALRFTSINFLCRDMEQLSDISRPADRVRQDISRSPGGDSALFLNTCVGCHSGMDALSGAFAYYDFEATDTTGRLIYTANEVRPKFLINGNTFPTGYVTTDNSWINYWRVGANAGLGWNATLAGVGVGAKSLGQEIASTRAFSQCQAQKVFENVCFRAASSPADRAEIERVATVFESTNYNLKRVFAETANFCKGL